MISFAREIQVEETFLYDILYVSECCGEYMTREQVEHGICPACQEHCDVEIQEFFFPRQYRKPIMPQITIITNNLYAHAYLWEDPSCPSIPNRIPSHWEVAFGGEYCFQTDQTAEQLENDLCYGWMNDMVNEDCEIDTGVSVELDYTLENGVCTIKIINAKYNQED